MMKRASPLELLRRLVMLRLHNEFCNEIELAAVIDNRKQPARSLLPLPSSASIQ